MKNLIAIVFAAIVCHCPGLAAQTKVINGFDDFQQFWQQAKNQPPARQEKLWADFEAKYSAVYATLLPTDPATRRKQLQNWLLKWRDLEPGMHRIFAQADSFTASQTQRFSQVFPDMAADMTVFYLPTMGINGAVREVADGKVLVIGVDAVAQSGESLDVLFAHEFFHLHQFQVLKSADYGNSMASPLWIEGFATWISGLMTPVASVAQQMQDSELGAACNAANVRLWAQTYQVIIDLPQNGQPYADWFRVLTDKKPKRRGYCLGSHAVAWLAKTHTVQQMVGWDEPMFAAQLKLALLGLADSSPTK
jgi:hypothetical protein